MDDKFGAPLLQETIAAALQNTLLPEESAKRVALYEASLLAERSITALFQYHRAAGLTEDGWLGCSFFDKDTHKLLSFACVYTGDNTADFVRHFNQFTDPAHPDKGTKLPESTNE